MSRKRQGSREVEKLAKKLPGWTLERRPQSGHSVFVGPEGQKVFCHFSPSDHRAMKNLISDLRRNGAPI